MMDVFEMKIGRNSFATVHAMSCNKTCPLNPSLHQIFTYDDCSTDIAINYILIVLLQGTILLHDFPISTTVLSTIYLWAFQITLCLIVGCIGVSVVWSSQMGILIHNRYFRTASSHPSWSICLFYASIAAGFIAWIYYAVIEEPITTIAHVCALAMGVLVDIVAQRWEINRRPIGAEKENASAPLIS